MDCCLLKDAASVTSYHLQMLAMALSLGLGYSSQIFLAVMGINKVTDMDRQSL